MQESGDSLRQPKKYPCCAVNWTLKYSSSYQAFALQASGTQDQSRAATPYASIKSGANFIVVGRPIMQSPDPVAAADSIVEEIAEALQD